MPPKSKETDELTKKQIVALLPRLYRFALAMTGSVAHAEDLVQDTCERAITRLDQWEWGTRLDSWLFRIAQNLYRSGHRDSSNRLRILDELSINHPAVIDGQTLVDDRTELAQIRHQISQLPDEQRDVLLLICVEGYSYREAADHLDLPIGTVRSRLSRARDALMQYQNTVPADQGQGGEPPLKAVLS